MREESETVMNASMTEQLTFFVSVLHPLLPKNNLKKQKQNEHEHIPMVNKREDKTDTS